MKKSIRQFTGILEIEFCATTKQRNEIALYQQGGISFTKNGRNKWIITFQYNPHDGDKLSLNATASTICQIANAGNPPMIDAEYRDEILEFFRTAEMSPETSNMRKYL